MIEEVPTNLLPEEVPANMIPSIDTKLQKIDSELNMPLGTAKRQLTVESRLNPNAYNKDSKAAGLAQIIPETQASLEARIGRKLDPYNEDDALLMYKAVMGENLQHWGNLGDALRAYNSGWIPSKWDNPETNKYVSTITAEEVPNQLLPEEVPAKLIPAISPKDLLNSNPTWSEALKQTAKSLYEVPLAMVTGTAGAAAGIAAGAIPSFLEKYALVPKGTGINLANKIQGSLAFQPTSPVAQAGLEGMAQIMPSNITDWTQQKLSELSGQPVPPKDVGGQALDFITNMMLGAKRAPEALGAVKPTVGPVLPTSPEIVPKAPSAAPEGIPEALLQKEASQAATMAHIEATSQATEALLTDTLNKSKIRTAELEALVNNGGLNTPAGANATVKIIANTSPTELIQHLDTALRQVETGLVESNYKRVSIGVTNQQAAALGYDPAAIMGKAFGQPLTAAEVQAVQNLSAAADTHLLGIAKREMAGDITLNPNDLGKAVAMKNTIMDYLQQGIGENARAMRQMQEGATSTTTLESSIKTMADNFGDVTVRQKAAQAIVNAASSPITLAQTVKAIASPTLKDKINQIIVNSYLTSPLTHEVSLVSHGSMPFIYLADQTAAAVFGLGDRAIAGALGKELPNVTTFGELGANLKGLYTGALEGYQVYKKVWKTETTQALPSEAGKGKFNALGTGPMARISNLPATEIMSHNQFFQAMVYRMALDGIAERDAWMSGLDSANKAMLAEKIRQFPTETQQAAAESIAKDYSFARELNNTGKIFSRLTNSSPLMKMNLPFIKIGINLGKQIVEHTPLALVSPRFYQDISGGAILRNAAIAKMTMGTLLLNEAWKAADQGTITGNAPSDPAQRAAWLALHPEKSYIGSDGQWHSHHALGLISDLLNASADLNQTWKEYQKARLINNTIGEQDDNLTDDAHTQAYWGLANTLYETLLDRTFFRTFTNIVDTATAKDPQAAQRGIGNYLAGLLPASPLFAFTTRQIDPIMRRTSDTVLDPLRARFPWTSPAMLPKINPVDGAVLQKVNPLVSVPQSTDRALIEMVRLGVKLPAVPNSFLLEDGGDKFRPPMLPEEQNYVLQFRGMNAKPIVDQMVNLPNWDKLPDQNKASLITMVYSNFQKAAEQILTSKIAQENKERIIIEIRRAMINTTKGQILLPEQLKP